MRIERGAVIADRYVVSAIERPWLADRPEAGVVCLALDAILDDPVILYAANPEFAGDLMDTGRRLALISDPRVPDVLDVGEGATEDGTEVIYVVCSRTAATSLAEILASGPIDPAPTRAIAGEVSEVLVHAARRGLHHRCLGPESVGITREGDVVVHGIAIDAALSELALGLEPRSDSAALREDALAVVDILYACLSGMWPKPESRAGLRAAPRKNTRVVDVEKLRSDLPQDLSSFVTGVTSRTDPGPRSPGEIIRYLREWRRGSLAQLEGSPLPDEQLFDPETAPGAEDAGAGSDGTVGGSGDASGGTPTGSGPEGAAARERTAGAGAASGADADAQGSGGEGKSTEVSSPGNGSPAAGGGLPTAGIAAGASTGAGVPDAPQEPGRASTSAGAGAVGAKPTANTGAAKAGTGMHSSGARPTSAPARPEPPAAPPKRRASPDQIQAAFARIGMSRPGTSGYSAGRADGVRTKLDEQMQMREASVFPLSGEQITASDSDEWRPEDTIAEYSNLAVQEQDRNVTAPIMNREELFTENLETQQMPVVTEADLDGEAGADGVPGDGAGEEYADGSWFLGGMFTTREEELAQQHEAFERERERERRLNEEARRRALEAEQRRERHRKATAAAVAPQGPAEAAVSSSDSSASGATGSEAPSAGAEGAGTSGGSGAAGRPRPQQPAQGGTGSVRTQPQDPAPAKEASRTKATSIAARSSTDTRPADTRPAGAKGSGAKSTASARAASGSSADGAPTRGASTAAAGGAASANSAAAAGSASAISAAGGTGASGNGRRRRTAAIWTIIGILLLVAALVFGFIAFQGMNRDKSPAPVPAPTAEPSPAPDEETQEPEAEGPAPVVSSVSDLDPEGDGSENPDMTDNVLSDDDSQWQTDRYNSAEFGGLKSGLGLAFELEEESLVSSVTLDSPDQGSQVEIRVGDSDDPEEARTVAETSLDGGTATVELEEPETAQYVFVWYTELAPAGEGYRGQLVQVKIA
ncbi:hypothetical protein [Brevibacterium album]|uniref:hypothetical protein n=1 Tax=Brevibacterium album TaxID=417948 RepID=UPI00040AD4D3|nr:hypothetical protein [Brevibacterium album]